MNISESPTKSVLTSQQKGAFAQAQTPNCYYPEPNITLAGNKKKKFNTWGYSPETHKGEHHFDNYFAEARYPSTGNLLSLSVDFMPGTAASTPCLID